MRSVTKEGSEGVTGKAWNLQKLGIVAMKASKCNTRDCLSVIYK